MEPKLKAVMGKNGCITQWVNPIVAKAGGVQSPRKRDFRFAPTSAKGEAVVFYCNPLATKDLNTSDFPERVRKMRKLLSYPGLHLQ